tara:strand:- start:1870 stop:2937 length:1068 start_codon:yes stop_codon:yes gene_type:complete
MKKKKKIIVSFGTRPEIIKLAPIINLLKKKKVDLKLVHSGQHYSSNMSKIFLNDFRINKIDYHLNFKKKDNSKKFINFYSDKFKRILLEENPDSLIVQGDTNTCLVSAFVAKILNNLNLIKTKIIHIEAGLRSYDLKMPEESNRIIVDHLSDILFPPTKIQKKILINEGIKKPIYVVGSTIADNLKNKKFDKISGNFFLLTIHRYENVTIKKRLIKIFSIMKRVSKIYKTKVIFPCHPNTQNKIKSFKIKLDDNISVINPVDYKKFLSYLQNCKVVFSDSGGLQEEACILKKHLITFRDNTERPETINIDANFLSMLNEEKVLRRLKKIFTKKISWKKHPYGINVSNKIVNYIIK